MEERGVSSIIVMAAVVVIAVIASAAYFLEIRGNGTGVSVSISPSSQSGADNTKLTYTVTVFNKSDVSDTYFLYVLSSGNLSKTWTTSVSPRSLNVSAGGKGTATMSVSIPFGEIGGKINHLTVGAIGTNTNGSAKCTAQVNIVRGVNVLTSPSSQIGNNGMVLTYTVTITNSGNVPDNYSLTVSDNALPSWGPSLSASSLPDVPAGGNGTATLSVSLPLNAGGGAVDNITVTVNGTGVNASDSCTARVSAIAIKQASVSIVEYAFQPSTITVGVGTTITWTNKGSYAHTVTSTNDIFSSGNLLPGKTFQFTFENAGTYNYTCTINGFAGTVIVQ